MKAQVLPSVANISVQIYQLFAQLKEPPYQSLSCCCAAVADTTEGSGMHSQSVVRGTLS